MRNVILGFQFWLSEDLKISIFGSYSEKDCLFIYFMFIFCLFSISSIPNNLIGAHNIIVQKCISNWGGGGVGWEHIFLRGMEIPDEAMP